MNIMLIPVLAVVKRAPMTTGVHVSFSIMVFSGYMPRGWIAGSNGSFRFSSVQFSRLVVSNSLRPHELQQARPPCPSPTPGVPSNSRPLSWWCHPAISSSVVPFFSCPQSLPASESFPMSQLFVWGGQSIGVSALASVLPKNTQETFLYFPAFKMTSVAVWRQITV